MLAMDQTVGKVDLMEWVIEVKRARRGEMQWMWTHNKAATVRSDPV